MNKDKNKKNSNKLLSFIILILIIIIIILLCLKQCEKRDDKYQIPTNNIDVFNIDINCKNSDTCPINNSDINEKDKNNKSNNKKNNSNKNDNDNKQTNNIDVYYNNNNTIIEVKNNENQSQDNEIPTYDEEDDIEVIGRVFIDDVSGDYIYQQNLNIFNNAAYEYTNKIAPGVSNTYNFKTNNASNIDIKYSIKMYEVSEYKVNLKYRLKRNGEYVIGNESNWVSASELTTAFTKLNKGGSDNYSLDWKWFDEDNTLDTIAGENMTSEYKLNIRFYFEQA